MLFSARRLPHEADTQLFESTRKERKKWKSKPVFFVCEISLARRVDAVHETLSATDVVGNPEYKFFAALGQTKACQAKRKQRKCSVLRRATLHVLSLSILTMSTAIRTDSAWYSVSFFPLLFFADSPWPGYRRLIVDTHSSRCFA